jgi:hypothetical protein
MSCVVLRKHQIAPVSTDLAGVFDAYLASIAWLDGERIFMIVSFLDKQELLKVEENVIPIKQ